MVKSTDKNIDHRRVPDLQKFFKRKGYELSISNNPSDYLTGDIVSSVIQGRPHIMIVSSKNKFRSSLCYSQYRKRYRGK